MNGAKRQLLRIVVGLVFVLGGTGWAGEGNPAPPAVVAHFHLSGALTESPMADSLGLLAQEMLSLRSLVERIDEAGSDDAVKAVILTYDGMSYGLGQLEEMRAALDRLKAAGKKVYVHAEGMSTFVYGLLCAGDYLSVAPQSSLWLTGLYGESLYVKDLLDKIGVQADFMHVGDYKSAAEMLTRTTPSEEAEENINWLLDGIYGSAVDMIAASRRKTPAQVRDLIDRGPYLADEALKEGLIDAVQTQEAFLAHVKAQVGGSVKIDNRYGREKKPEINVASPLGLFAILSELFKPPQMEPKKDSIALIYVEGAILPGYGQPSLFGGAAAFSGDIRKALQTAADDDSVKAVVMRVDSPGGSAEASEVILNATRLVQIDNKPFVVSMGDVAASGGYYISCGADVIFADEATVTASIGVVGGKLVTQDLWTMLGVNWVGYKRGANSDIFSSSAPFSDAQRKTLEQYMQKVYDVFKGHVTEGRGSKLTKPLDEMAGGRVYTGKQALGLGLVDQIGGLKQAIEYAAAKASLRDYEVRVVPRPIDFVTALLEEISGEGERPTDLAFPDATSLLAGRPHLMSAYELLRCTEPQRAQALYQALQRIELIRREGVIMMMPFDPILH
ncbi:MAG: signal peptide peptidase SppA [Sedimentisphaerales bacterium]|nr:signal peptide peptidase SppA [Sedimentisphaerales bacterium]